MIYHAALPDDWAEAQQSGTYTTSTRGRSLAEEGFIHASYEHQVDGVVKRYYADIGELVLLVIDPEAIGSPVIDESPTGDPADEHFPHIYGPIPVGAVADARRWVRQSGKRSIDRQNVGGRPERNPDQTGRV